MTQIYADFKSGLLVGFLEHRLEKFEKLGGIFRGDGSLGLGLERGFSR